MVDNMPDILTAKMIAGHIHVTVQQVYNLFNLSPEKGGIRNFSIGKSRRVMREDYLRWLEARQKETP